MSDYPNEAYKKADYILNHYDKLSHKDRVVLARDLHKWALEYAAKASTWISVEDRLPDGECLAVGYQGEQLIGYIGGDVGRYFCESEGVKLEDVTHWKEKDKSPK